MNRNVIRRSGLSGGLMTASMQGGIVAIWDANTQKIEHISESSYCVAADLYNGKVYRLLCVSNFMTKAHFELWETSVGIFDSNEEGDPIDIEFPYIVNEFDGFFLKLNCIYVPTKSILR